MAYKIIRLRGGNIFSSHKCREIPPRLLQLNRLGTNPLPLRAPMGWGQLTPTNLDNKNGGLGPQLDPPPTSRKEIFNVFPINAKFHYNRLLQGVIEN